MILSVGEPVTAWLSCAPKPPDNRYPQNARPMPRTTRTMATIFHWIPPRVRCSVGKHAGAQIAVAAVADDGNDHGLLELPRDAQRDVHGAAGGDAGEDAFLARQAARRLLGVGLAHVLQPVDAGALVDLRQVRLRPLADARDLRALLGLAADDLDRALLLLEEARAAHDGAGGAHA